MDNNTPFNIDTRMGIWSGTALVVLANITPGELLKTGLTFSADERQLYFLGGSDRDPARTDIYVISELAPKPVIIADLGGLKGAPIVDPAGKVLLFTVPAAR